MISSTDLRELNTAHFAGDRAKVGAIKARLGEPSQDDISAAALALLDSQDRSERVLAVRILTIYGGRHARAGIFRALGDGERRVRDVAVRSSVSFLEHREIVEKLQSIVSDDREKRKIRARAFDALTGSGAQVRLDDLPAPAVAALDSISKLDSYRMKVLFGLLQVEPSPPVETILKSFVKDGSKDEAVLATRALCGYRVVNLGRVQDPDLRSRIESSCDLAAGQVWYWVESRLLASGGLA